MAVVTFYNVLCNKLVVPFNLRCAESIHDGLCEMLVSDRNERLVSMQAG